jgi:adenine-specific DNA-methyltransferase
MEPVERESEPVNRRRIDLLRAEFPEAWSEGKLGFDKLKEALGEFTDASSERYSFSWSGKRDALRILQTPTRGTLVPARVESVEFDETGNLFIEGDNLEVLKLLYKSYFRRVKLIYIDPPFNTGGDFIYPDNFRDPLEPYLKLVGDMDEEGNLLTTNPDTSGRFHSSWLSMMYPRLFIARQLLADDGAIFVEIDDNEVHNLRMIMNEIFGEENFVATIIWL